MWPFQPAKDYMKYAVVVEYIEMKKGNVVRCEGGKHKGPFQEYTETCLACGRNSYETYAEYERWLDEQLKEARIREKERKVDQYMKPIVLTPQEYVHLEKQPESCLRFNTEIGTTFLEWNGVTFDVDPYELRKYRLEKMKECLGEFLSESTIKQIEEEVNAYN